MRLDLRNIVLAAADDGFVDQKRGFGRVLGEIDVPHRFLGPGAEHLVFGDTDAQAQQHALVASVVKSFGAGEEPLADSILRVGLATSMPSV
jgi:predicted dienelactone hydrolase